MGFWNRYWRKNKWHFLIILGLFTIILFLLFITALPALTDVFGNISEGFNNLISDLIEWFRGVLPS